MALALPVVPRHEGGDSTLKTILFLKLSAVALTGYLIISGADIAAPCPVALQRCELMASALTRLDGRRDPRIDRDRFLTFNTRESFDHLT
ncbi:protein of unknown function (plasmid) [Cupriavidus taiwanensis]|uniref:Uncharacterized protein n=1 Tax=Cupriavidus taiwanensis TaxID=164546 RepID=A0A375IMT7_9BURK|nr:protein of unknown function [Cupriavidus taiwanensis]